MNETNRFSSRGAKSAAPLAFAVLGVCVFFVFKKLAVIRLS